jgi:hypothetical protein
VAGLASGAENLAATGIRPRTGHPVASSLSVYAIPAHVDRSVDKVKKTEQMFDIAVFTVNVVEATLVK